MNLYNRIAVFIFLSFGIFLGNFPLEGAETSQDPCEIKQLPAGIQKILQNKFSSWRVLTLNDLAKEDQSFWTRSEKRSRCPGMAIGHYEIKTDLSYVLSLVPQTGHPEGHRLIIFSPQEEGQYRHDVLEKQDGAVNPLVVYTVPPGKYWNDERTKSIQLSMEGFQTEEKEKGAFLYFWDVGTLRQWSISE